MDNHVADLQRDIGGSPFTSLDSRVEAASQKVKVPRGNRLLESLEDRTWDQLQPHLESTPLVEGQVIEMVGQRSAFLYFPTKGGVSLEAGPANAPMQLALVGREGLIGTGLLLGGVALCRSVVQFGGAARRIPTDALEVCLDKSPRLHRQLLLGVHAFLDRLSRMAWANGRSLIEQRLAYWLLSAADCLDTNHIPVTHQALSNALGVRRPSVTIAMHALEQTGAVRIQRGHIRILDSQRLAAAAGNGFAGPTALLGASHEKG